MCSQSSHWARSSWAAGALLRCAPKGPPAGLGETQRGQSPARVASAGPSEERGGRGCPCELTPASPFVQACPRREASTLGQLCPSLWGCPCPHPSLVCPPSSLPLGLSRGHLDSQGHVACILCRPHRTLRMGKRLCSGFISLASWFFCHRTEIQLIFVN